MLILRSNTFDGYYTKAVYTKVGGRRIYVSEGYYASTRAEVIRLAYLNAGVRNMIAQAVGSRFQVAR